MDFSFCIRKNNVILAIESYHHALSQLEDTLKNHEWINKKYASTHINITSKKHTLIPASIFFDKNELQNYLQFNHYRSENQDALSDKLQQLGSTSSVWNIRSRARAHQHFFPKSNH